MEEYVFRGKSVETGEWIYGSHFFDVISEKEHILSGIYVDTDYSELPVIAQVEVDPATVGLWTGLFDKNGEKIFSNHTFHTFDDDTVFHTVKYKDGAFGYNPYDNSDYDFISFAQNDNFEWKDGKSDKIEIIHEVVK